MNLRELLEKLINLREQRGRLYERNKWLVNFQERYKDILPKYDLENYDIQKEEINNKINVINGEINILKETLENIIGDLKDLDI